MIKIRRLFRRLRPTAVTRIIFGDAAMARGYISPLSSHHEFGCLVVGPDDHAEAA